MSTSDRYARRLEVGANKTGDAMTAHLQAALAFALTMLALATIVTVIMEILLRFFRRRNRHLRHMLELVYEKHIAPQIIDATDGIHQEADRAAKAMGEAADNWPVFNRVKVIVDHWNNPEVRAILSHLPGRSWQKESRPARRYVGREQANAD